MKITKTDKLLAATLLKLLPSWVLPNHITIFRFLTIPFVLLFLVTEEYVWGIILFSFSAFSDCLDGALARTKNKITDWGKLFDPLADKMLICITAAFLITRHISAFVAFGIIFIEILFIVVGYYKKRFKNIIVQAHLTGKIKMWLQSVGIGMLFIFSIFPSFSVLVILAKYAFFLAIILALISLLVYRSI